MTFLDLNLPSEIINKIFSYIEGNNNQIIKKEFININSFGKDHITFTLDLIRRKLIPNKMLYDKYFKYTLLHKRRKILLIQIKFTLNPIINRFNYYNDYYNYPKILNQVRENYIYDCYYKCEITQRQLRKYHDVYFKYTILHENHKNVCNHIERYNTKRRFIDNKKIFKYLLLDRGIVINFIKKDNKNKQN
jgi:hypothetical protein